VVLNAQELSELMANIAYDLNYSSVYSHSNLFKKGDAIQKDPKGDLIGITMAGQVEGSISSASFDGDGLSLGSIRLVEGGKAINYFGANRFGQYLGETPTGNLRCLCVDAGTADSTLFLEGPYLEVVSMSGLQVDFSNDYIGGEIRLAYYHDGSDIIPVTGLSISGKLEDVLNRIRLSTETTVYNGYQGPKKAILDCMKIF
jgi:PmbA protein